MAAGATPAPDASFYVRRCDPDDVDTIVAMYERTFHGGSAAQPEWFARFHGLPGDALGAPSSRKKLFVSLIETCFMSVTVEDDDGQIAGFVALDDTPVQMLNAEGAGTDWESWFASVFPGVPEVDGTTSLWFSCCLLDPDYSATIMAEVLRTTFSTMHDLQHLLAYVPGGLSEEEARLQLLPFESGHFEELPAADPAPPGQGHWTASSGGEPPQVLRCSRQAVITPLHIRMARVEDHDNLAAIFDLQSEVITQVYGEYFLAELIEAQNEQNKALVAEVDGAAVGLLCLTSDVDINVLAQCFQLDSYDNFLKPQYMRRVREHAAAAAAGEDLPLCSSGDYMQVALDSIDFEALLEGLPKLEDGRLTAVNLHIALQQQEFADEVGDAVQDFERGFMTLMWQMQWAEPMLEGGSLVETRRVMSCVHTFLYLNLEARREIAQTVLDRWDEVLEIYRLTREALWSQAAAEAQEEAGGVEAKEDDGEAGGGEQMDEAAASRLVDTVVFFKALSVEEDGPFSQEFLATLMMALHWWTEEDLTSPLAIVPDDVFRASLTSLVVAEEGLFVSSPSAPSWLANMPQHAKDVFCVNMCCLDQAYQTQALDFLLPAFSLYPSKDYCIITQPHTAPNTPLLNAFTIVPPQPQNTFGHVLFLIHRAALLGPPSVRSLAPGDVEGLAPLVGTLDEETQAAISEECGSYLEQKEPATGEQQIFVAEFDEQLVGLISLRVPPADVVVTLRCAYHLDDYLLVEHHHDVPNRGHAQLAHFVVNPLFQKYTRRLQQLALRKCRKTVLFMQTDLQQSVPSIFRELLQVAPRRPPQLKKVPRKPPKVASFVNVEKPVPTVEDLQEDARQQLLRDLKQTKALSVITKKLLSETKIPVNARIVVVGASDCGLSFLESLLSIPHLVFNSLTLLAPGGLEYHHEHHLPLVAGTAAYSHHELRRIMLEFRVRILDSRMVQIDRQQRCCILHDGTMLPYDYLVVAAGLQDDALHSLKIRSWGVEHVTDGYRRVNGAMSVADPSIRDLLVEGGTLVKSLIWNPLSYAVVYGRSLHAYCVVQGLLMRKVPPTKILLVLPPRLKDASHRLPVDAFYAGDEVEAKIHSILASMGLQVFEGYRLLGIQQDNRERLKSLILEEHPSGHAAAAAGGQGHDESLQQPSSAGGEGGRRRFVGGVLEEAGTTPDGLPQKMLACRIIITADSVNVDPDIFNSVHGNGLVYDGRLIVDHNFKTTDNAIFSAGSLCEFSRRFQRKNAMRYLRHDGFNGREVGAKLAQALLRILDPVNGDMVAAGAMPRPPPAQQQEEPPPAAPTVGAGDAPAGAATAREVAFFEGLDSEEASPEMLPEFYMPLARGGFLPGNLHFYRIYACRRGELDSEPAELRPDQCIVTDTLDTANGTGHFCRLTVDNFGKVDSITYLGGEELQVESLWSLVGLSETFLNHIYLRWRDGDIPDVVEFLTDEWATALFHDRFSDFCHQIKLEMMSSEEVKTIINGALDSVNLKEGLSRDLLTQIRAKLPKEAVRAIQEHLLDYLRENTNHLKAYFLPENWVEAR